MTMVSGMMESGTMDFEFGPELDKLAGALVTFQGKVQAVAKTKTAKVPTKSGGSYSYDYADLADVIASTKDARQAAGLAVVQMPVGSGTSITVVTTVLHSSGQWMRGKLTMRPEDTRPQTIGSLITYMRRYCYSAALGISTEADDDGAAAQGRGPDPKGRAGGTDRPVPVPTNDTQALPKASEIPHDGKMISEPQLRKLHAMRREAGGQWCTDEDDERSMWRMKVLAVYRDQQGNRISSSKQLSQRQASHLIDRIAAHIAKSKERMANEPDLSALFGPELAIADLLADMDRQGIPEQDLCSFFSKDTVKELSRDEVVMAGGLVRAWNDEEKYELAKRQVLAVLDQRNGEEGRP